MVETSPGHVGDVKQTVHAIEIHERTEVGDVLDDTDDFGARGDAFQELLALLGALGLDDFAAAEDDVLALVVDFDNLELEHLAHVLVEILGRNDVDLAAGQEGFNANVDHEAAFDDSLDLAADETAFAEHGGDFLPVLLVGGFLLGEDDHAFVVLEALQEHFDFVADVDVFIFKLGRRNSTLRFVADVDEDDLRLDFKDASFDDRTFLVGAERCIDQFREALCTHVSGMFGLASDVLGALAGPPSERPTKSLLSYGQ